MVLEFIINISITIIRVLLTFILPGIPVVDVFNKLIVSITAILTICSQAGNFGYFLLGDSLYIIIPILTILLTYKYIAFPILTTIRHFLMWGSG